jgi:hypothetical protein
MSLPLCANTWTELDAARLMHDEVQCCGVASPAEHLRLVLKRRLKNGYADGIGND